MFTLSLINPTTEVPFFTRTTRNATWSTTRAGEERLRAIIDDISLSDAVALFDKATFAFVRISKNAEIAWQGVVTDVQVTYSNNKYTLVVNAVGYAFLFRNVHTTGMFSTTDTFQLFFLNNTQLPNSVNDTRIRIFPWDKFAFITPGGSMYMMNERICIAYRCPDKSLYAIKNVEAHWFLSYSGIFPFIFEIYGISNAPSDAAWTIAYTQSQLPINQYISISFPDAYQAVVFAFRTPSNANVQIYPSDLVLFLVTFRLLTTSAPIIPSKIFNLRGVNCISNIQQQNDLLNVVVEDKTDAELFDLVCQRDNIEYATLAPNVVELRYRDELNHREKYRIVADTIAIARDATTIVNNVYARYRDNTNRTLRTQRLDDPVARDVYANSVFRDTFIDVDTYDQSVANTARKKTLEALRSGSMRLRATTRNVARKNQNLVPPWKVRAGSVAGIVNLGKFGYGQVSEVIIDRTDYDAATDTLTIESQIDAL